MVRVLSDLGAGSRRWFLCFFAAFFLVLALSAQETPAQEMPLDEEKPSTGIFPLTLVLEAAKYAGAGVWQPDWPLELPPDAFKVLSGDISRAVIEGEDFSLTLGFGSGGLVEEFPFMLNGRMTQVGLVYDAMEIRELTITISAEDSYKMEFLEYKDSCPALVRASRLDVWYFIYFSRGVNEIRETWYDEEGNFLGAYGFSLAEIGKKRRIRALKDFSVPEGGTDFYYDSRGFLTEASGLNGLYKVLYYREDLPRYWERWEGSEGVLDEAENSFGTGNFSLQWDERGLLVRITGESADYRYEYTLDERGNWIERREIRMIRGSGLLIPSAGATFKRVLEYRNPS